MEENQNAAHRNGFGVGRPAAHSLLGTTLRAGGAAGTELDPSSAAFLQDILDSLADGVIVADREGRFVQFNEAAKRFLGLGPIDVDPPLWSATYGCFRDDRVTPFPSDELPLARSLRGETVMTVSSSFETRACLRASGSTSTATPLRDENGAVRRRRDLPGCDFKKRELARVELLSAVVEQTADSVIITDREGVIEYEPGCRKTIGFGEPELIGRTRACCVPACTTRHSYADLWKTVLEGRVYRHDRQSEEERHAVIPEQTITPIRETSGAIFISRRSAGRHRAQRAASDRASFCWRDPFSSECTRWLRPGLRDSISPEMRSWLTRRAETTSTSSRSPTNASASPWVT
jgi:PAS domain-containing protein